MKRHTILLYNPQAVFFTMPLALLALGSNLDPSRYQVIIVDGRLEKDALATLQAHADEALCLGITVLTGAPIRDALRVSRAMKARRPSLPVIWGGWHPSLFPTLTLTDEPSVDITVQGQGEVTFAELVDHLAAGKSLAGVAGIAYREGSEVHQNPPRPLADPNTLPEVNYRLIEVQRYFRLKRRAQLDYITSAGCYFRCAFCADPFVYNRKWKALSAQRVGREVAKLHREYRFEDLDFQDETFFTYPSRVAAIAEEFLRSGQTFSWAGTMRADQGCRMSEEEFAHCRRSGLRRVLIGVESGSQEMLDWMKKDIRIEQVLECAEKCRRHGIAAIFPFIVGFPGEDEDSVAASLRLIKKLRAMDSAFTTPIFYFKPYPGSAITRRVQEEGYRLPATTEEWAGFDYVGSSGPWVSAEKHLLVERFKFYSRIAWGEGRWWQQPLRRAARWRCLHDFYHWPLEKFLADRILPAPRLS